MSIWVDICIEWPIRGVRRSPACRMNVCSSISTWTEQSAWAWNKTTTCYRISWTLCVSIHMIVLEYTPAYKTTIFISITNISNYVLTATSTNIKKCYLCISCYSIYHTYIVCVDSIWWSFAKNSSNYVRTMIMILGTSIRVRLVLYDFSPCGLNRL